MYTSYNIPKSLSSANCLPLEAWSLELGALAKCSAPKYIFWSGLKGGGTVWAIPLQNVRWRDALKSDASTHTISRACATTVQSAFDPRSEYTYQLAVGQVTETLAISTCSDQGSRWIQRKSELSSTLNRKDTTRGSATN